ncbi:MAG TPA: hypothetical protein VGP99_07500, partial [Tepidisphaeraceae bacterium]|nr:hypothetical protein [Tepidisphaeraceae bacterium]
MTHALLCIDGPAVAFKASSPLHLNDGYSGGRGSNRNPFEEMLKAEPAPTPPPLVKLAASRPDAAPKKLDTALRVAVHATILASVVAFVVYYCVWSPVRGQMMTQREAAIATVVAYPLYSVRTPDVSGVFIAEKALANGAYVKNGQLLGKINSPALDAQIEQKALELQILQARQLQPRQSSDALTAWQSDQEGKELTLRVAIAAKALEQLNATKKQLIVRAPCDGFVQYGLAGSQAVQPHQALVSLYPQRTELMIEITAPIEVINDLEGQNRVVTEFSTASGKVKVECKPIQASTRSFIKTIDGKREETWGVLQCAPGSMPLNLR